MKQKLILSIYGFVLFLITALSACKKDPKGILPPNQSLPKPVANASFSLSTQYAPVLVKFTNQSLHANRYTWYIGSSKVSEEQNPELLLAGIGNNTIRLVAKNNAGDSAVKEFSISVTKHPLLLHHFAFSNDFSNTGSATTAAGSISYSFAPDRKQTANSAVYFNGVNTFVLLPNGMTGVAQDSISISLWFKPDDLTRAGVIFGHQSGALNTAPVHFVPVIYYSATGKLYAGLWNGRFTEGINAGTVLNNWVHVVVAANATGQDIYVNGEKIKTINGRAADSHMPFAYLGATYTNNGWTELTQGGNFFKGWIDDVRVYRKKLHVDEVRSLYKE